MQNNDTNGNSNWTQWSKFVLKELERLNKNYDDLHKSVSSQGTDLALIKDRTEDLDSDKINKMINEKILNTKELEELVEKKVDNNKMITAVSTKVNIWGRIWLYILTACFGGLILKDFIVPILGG